MLRTLLLACALAMPIGLQAAISDPFSEMFVFGDSLSDQGNFVGTLPTQMAPYSLLIPTGPYAGGSFSNGPVWVQHLATQLIAHNLLTNDISASNSGGNNYAFGGARTGALSGITPAPFPEPFFAVKAVATNVANAPGPLPSDALYVVSGGGNDVRAALNDFADGLITEQVAIDAMAVGAQNLIDAIEALGLEGAETFLVPNLLNLGRAPEVIINGPGAVINGENVLARTLVEAFNASLAEKLAMIADPSLNIIEIDAFADAEDVFNNPLAFGFTNVTDACALAEGGAGCLNPDEYLFWDGLHPTTAAHALSADRAFAALVPIPAALWLLVPALGVLGVRRRV